MQHHCRSAKVHVPPARVLVRCYGRLGTRWAHTTPPALDPALASTHTKAGKPLLGAWSSPRDQISRKAFSGDIQQAWSLLQACLEHRFMERAESVLLGLTEISPAEKDVVLAVNVYLLRLVELNAGRPSVATDWLRRIRLSVPRFRASEVTEAILVKNAWLSGNPELLKAYIKERRLGPDQLVDVLRRVEVLGAPAIREIMRVAQIPESRVSKHTQHFLRQTDPIVSEAAIQTAKSTASPDQIAEPIPKGQFGELAPTESAGLRSIRHVLTALKTAQHELKDLPLVQDKEADGANYVDFFEIYRRLDNENDKREFDAQLDKINEKRQRLIETRGVEAARMKWHAIFERMAEADQSGAEKVNLKGLETLLWQWNQAMLPLVRAEIAKLKQLGQYKSIQVVPPEVRQQFATDDSSASASSLADKFEYGPYLTLAQPENLPAMTMMELLRLNSAKGSSEGVRSVKAVLNVGKNVELEYHLGSLRDQESRRRADRSKPLASVRTAISNGEVQAWPSSVRAKIGSLMISLFMKVARVPVQGTDPETGQTVTGMAPAFHHTYQYQNGNKVGVLRPHKVVARYLSGETTAAVIQPQMLPMLVAPKPWTAWNDGGYHYTPSRLIRSRGAPEQVAYVQAASDRHALGRVYAGLNVLGQTPWTINSAVFRVVSEIWNSRKEFLDIPPHVPPTPDLSNLVPPARSADPEARRDYLREWRRLTLENGRLYSQRCDLNYKLDIARAYLGERFYMPHNLDFRGRAYPLSPHLNHLGNDVSRSLLMFWNGRKLGERGLYWLKVHLANLFGVNKASHEERIAFVDEHIRDILDSADHPLDGSGWWKAADSPFQCLAACMEIRDALRHPQGPTEFVSHLSVHQDGSCNGLQHYAALGGDVDGAFQVNLAPADRPQDVYSKVLEIVRKTVEDEVQTSNNAVAKLVLPHLTRKVVKQTVMTHVYGVTFVGAREQIANRLRELPDFPADQVYRGANYLANRVLEAVRRLFESAHEIQDWLGENATRITRSIVVGPNPKENYSDKKFMSAVIWTTPLGLPIVQPYRQEKRRQVTTELQTVYIADPYAFQSVNPRKQRMAFPPNYIHSLDATHMLMSALACSQAGIDFASVHDSYWTHAGDVDTMNQALRRCFVELHSENLISKLRREFQERYGQHLQCVEVPLDSELGQRVVKLRKQKFPNMRGVTHLPVQDQVDMELKAEDSDVTPLRLVRELGDKKLDELIAEAHRCRKENTPDLLVSRSTEHAGTGLDVLAEREAQAEETETEGESQSTGKPRRRVVSLLAPLYIPEIPKKGSFRVEQVLESPYFFS